MRRKTAICRREISNSYNKKKEQRRNIDRRHLFSALSLISFSSLLPFRLIRSMLSVHDDIKYEEKWWRIYLETASCTIFSHDAYIGWVDAGPEKGAEVIVPQVSHLQNSRASRVYYCSMSYYYCVRAIAWTIGSPISAPFSWIASYLWIFCWLFWWQRCGPCRRRWCRKWPNIESPFRG